MHQQNLPMACVLFLIGMLSRRLSLFRIEVERIVSLLSYMMQRLLFSRLAHFVSTANRQILKGGVIFNISNMAMASNKYDIRFH